MLVDYYDGLLKITQDSAKSVALEVKQQSNSPYHVALANFMLAYWQSSSNEKVTAITTYLEALGRLNEADTSDRYLEINIRKNVGVILYEYRSFEYALEFYRKALPFTEEYSVNEEADLLIKIGNSLRKLDSLDAAEKSYRNALLLSEGNLKKTLQILNQSALLEQDRNDFEKAEKNFQRLIIECQESSANNQIYLWMAHHNLGNIYNKQERYAEMQFAFEAALTFALSPKHILITLKDLGHGIQQSGNQERAIELWRQAESFYSDVTLHPDHFELFKYLAQALPEHDPSRWQYFQQYTQELERYQLQSEKIKELATRGYVNSLINRYFDEVSEAEFRKAQLWQFGMFLAGIISTLLALLVWQWWKKRGLSKKVGSLNGTIDHIEATLTEAIKATERHSS